MSLSTSNPPGVLQVLLVEDEPADARSVSQLLSEADATFALSVVGRLSEAVERLKTTEVACVLLDLGLPDSRDLEGLVQVRETAPEVPVVVLTGRNEDLLAQGALEEGAQDYLVKGHVDTHGLARSIRHAVKRQELQNRGQEAARAELADSQSLMRALLDHIPAAVWVKDLEYRYVMVNGDGAHQVGKEPSEIIGKTDFDIYPEEVATAFRTSDMEVFESRIPYQLEEAVAVKGGGRFYLTIKFPINGEDRSTFAVGGVSIDVHDRVQAQRELAKVASELKSWAAQLELTSLELRKANAELDQFANAVAHDLTEPLRTITSYIRLLAAAR